MKNERFEELMGLFLDGEIATTQLDELAELVAADPARLEELRSQLAMTDQLSQSEDQRRAEYLISSLKTTRRRASVSWGGSLYGSSRHLRLVVVRLSGIVE